MNTAPGHPNPLFHYRSATWVVRLNLAAHLGYICAIAWVWLASDAPRVATTGVLVGLFALATAACVIQAVTTGSEHNGEPDYYAQDRDGTWKPLVSLISTRDALASLGLGITLLTFLITGVYLKQHGPSVVEVVAFIGYTAVSNAAVWVTLRHISSYRQRHSTGQA
ncbi:hypothetical protein AXK56_20270 [Tsukamurella pulmonis]|uniref:Uncharacterized protein n=1 Tax=Tsukamurella pulmonis TaxID=47312 RepID=A0A1H1H9E4_9ACTN|nr:hypothetical protein [Tsukamurella pulmonis]KXO94927.1 hypothetical protein AXK56_20270 [Tsukamurella pulmonis]SDR22030.1 hypothetical protein SAMN04489765_3938 [Tsukamurella pulmonis]SUP15541.1 Uncharacterised protein [Tsukamurella pulmonis]